MRYLFIYIILVFNFGHVLSQTININIKNLNKSKAAFSYIRGEDIVLIDSLFPIGKTNFHYSFAKNASHLGLYRLSLADSSWIDFIIDWKDVTLNTDADNIIDSMTAINSESNKIYYDFLRLTKEYNSKTEKLRSILSKYSKDDNDYISAENKLHQLQKEYLQFVKVFSQKDKKSFAARYIQSVQLPVDTLNLPNDVQKANLKMHSLDNINFDDDDLIYSNAFPLKLKDYLALFKDPKLPKDLIEKEYMQAVDTILNKAKVNQLVYEDITEYLINEFKGLGYNDVIVYLVDNYVIKDDLCIDDKLRNSIQRRMDQSKRFRTGAVVPNIIIPDSTGINVDLMNIKTEKILIIFYASWCPHCQRIMPKLNYFYNNTDKEKFKILAISIDTSRTDWLNFVRKNNFTWINVSDLKGGSGKSLEDYYIYATPTMFLLNDKKEIIAVPADLDELKKALKPIN
jgi:thiol-disulfide isomerase/thioredoxin